MDKTTTPLKTIDEIKESLETILIANDYKPGSKIAMTCEVAFLQGMMVADNRYMSERPALAICMMSNRSIFTL